MDLASLIPAGMGFVTILLLLYLVYQFANLRDEVAKLARRQFGPDTAAASTRRAPSIDPAFSDLQDTINRMERRLASLDNAFSDLHGLVADFTQSAQEPNRRSVPPPPRPEPTDPLGALPATERPLYTNGGEGDEPNPRPQILGPQTAAVAPAGGLNLEVLLEEYRQLLAQPRKSEINRWADERGGEACEVHDDGGFEALSRDSGGLLILLKIDAERAVVLPGGRLVADFATNFANAISMRSVTRECFDLLNDGSGVIRLIEPALARRGDGRWRLDRPGKLAGFTSD